MIKTWKWWIIDYTQWNNANYPTTFSLYIGRLFIGTHYAPYTKTVHWTVDWVIG